MGEQNSACIQTVGEKVNRRERNSSDHRPRFPIIPKYKDGSLLGEQMDASEGLAAATRTMFT